MPTVSMDRKLCAQFLAIQFWIRFGAQHSHRAPIRTNEKKKSRKLSRSFVCFCSSFGLCYSYYFQRGSESFSCIFGEWVDIDEEKKRWRRRPYYKFVTIVYATYTHKIQYNLLYTKCKQYVSCVPHYMYFFAARLLLFRFYFCCWVVRFCLFQVHLIDSFNCSFRIVSYFTFPFRLRCSFSLQ